MKYEKLKKEVALGFWNEVENMRTPEAMTAALLDAVAEKRWPRTSAKILADRCYDIIMRWDIRCVGRLRDLLPGYFPKTLMVGALVASMEDDGEWHVVRT